MYVLIKEIKQSAGLWMKFDSEEELKSSDLEMTTPVSVKITLSNAETRIVARGEAWGTALVGCARCGEDFELALNIEIDENFLAEDSPEAKVSGIDVFEILTYKDDKISLDEMLRQNFLAAIPMQPICHQGKCRGLCDQCGSNQNTESCQCKEKEIDPRWAALGEIKNKSSKPSLN